MSNGRLSISLRALTHNYLALQRLATPGAEVAGVVRANAFGLGVEHVLPCLVASGCNTFFVATADEGVAALKAAEGSTAPQIVTLMGLDPAQPAKHVSNDLTPAVTCLDELAEFRVAVEQRLRERPELGRQRVPVALQVDTGLARLGLDAKERTKFAAEAPKLLGDHLSLDIVMSDLAKSVPRDFSERQFNRFVDFHGKLENVLGTASADAHPMRRSLANSFGMFRDRKLHMDIVRPGMALYGGQSSLFDQTNDITECDLRQVVNVTGPVQQVRHAEQGAIVGYALAYEVKQAEGETLAIIGVGYADGYFRACNGDNGTALYWSPAMRGDACDTVYRVPMRGRVSMDSIIVDITHVPEEHRPRLGDFLEVLGEHQTPEQWGAHGGFSPYEVLSSLGTRYDRFYDI